MDDIYSLIDIQKKIMDIISTAADLHAAINYIGNAHQNTATPETQPELIEKDTKPTPPPEPHMTTITTLLNELGASISDARDKTYSIRNWVNPSD